MKISNTYNRAEKVRNINTDNLFYHSQIASTIKVKLPRYRTPIGWTERLRYIFSYKRFQTLNLLLSYPLLLTSSYSSSLSYTVVLRCFTKPQLAAGIPLILLLFQTEICIQSTQISHSIHQILLLHIVRSSCYVFSGCW